jgi:hypothetical protein
MDFRAFRLPDDEREQLLRAQHECTITWVDADGWPVGAVQNYLWERGAFWVTSFRDRPRVSCLQAEPRSAVVVSSAGTDVGAERMVSARTLATVHDDEQTADWFYLPFCRRASADEEQAARMARFLARQDRVIIELQPQGWNSFDGLRMRA